MSEEGVSNVPLGAAALPQAAEARVVPTLRLFFFCVQLMSEKAMR